MHRGSANTYLRDLLLRRRSLLGILGAAPLAAAAAPLTHATASARHGGTDPGAGKGQGSPPADLLPAGAYDQHLAALAAQDQFSGTVLLAYQDRPVLARSFGWADKAKNIPNRTDTLFDLASVTKIFTGVVVAQLAAQGKIDFFATLGTYLDGFFAQIADTVTVHQLLTHTAGMGDYTQTPAFIDGVNTWNSAAAVFNGIMGIIRTLQMEFTPGTKYQYSNTGFYVLGAIVAQVSGQSYYDYMRQHVFSAAGMTRTDFYIRPEQPSNRDIAHPHALRNGQHIDVAGEGGFIGGPDHGAYSSGPDLLARAPVRPAAHPCLRRTDAQRQVPRRARHLRTSRPEHLDRLRRGEPHRQQRARLRAPRWRPGREHRPQHLPRRGLGRVRPGQLQLRHRLPAPVAKPAHHPAGVPRPPKLLKPPCNRAVEDYRWCELC
jgi:CubicO group peptidase (beta-lactamase class C family)